MYLRERIAVLEAAVKESRKHEACPCSRMACVIRSLCYLSNEWERLCSAALKNMHGALWKERHCFG